MSGAVQAVIHKSAIQVALQQLLPADENTDETVNRGDDQHLIHAYSKLSSKEREEIIVSFVRTLPA